MSLTFSTVSHLQYVPHTLSRLSIPYHPLPRLHAFRKLRLISLSRLAHSISSIRFRLHRPRLSDSFYHCRLLLRHSPHHRHHPQSRLRHYEPWIFSMLCHPLRLDPPTRFYFQIIHYLYRAFPLRLSRYCHQPFLHPPQIRISLI
jgi:hypothetical protein